MFNFTCVQIESNGSLVFVIVKDGMEIFTSRSHIAALHNTEHFDNVTKVTRVTTTPRLYITLAVLQYNCLGD